MQRKISVAEYDKNPDHGRGTIRIDNDFYDKFVGTWIWEKIGKKLSITFVQKDISIPDGNEKTILKYMIGKFDYYVDGKLVPLEKEKSEIHGFSLNNPNQVIFEIDYRTKVWANSVKIELKYVSKNELRFQYITSPTEEGKKRFPYPVDIDLKRK